MQIIADLHLHSKYSRAVSQQMDLEGISSWAKKKGINLATCADWTHPLWFKEIKTKLKEKNTGIYNFNGINFLLTTEISSIYSQGGQVRRIHNLIFSPSLAACEKIIAALKSRGANLMADGRPIVGLSSKEILELIKTADENCFLIPCHAWTPWFALYGSKSGFNSIEECFGTAGAKQIYAVETGLSSDPIMNWQIKELENRSLVSFSDAHSGPKLGREATVFTCNAKHETCNVTYKDIIDAIKQTPNSHLKIGYTIEFFPEEGKYHWSGHRACGIRYTPAEIKEKGIICPVCRRPLTVGVENRVLDLASKMITKKDLLMVKNKSGVTFVSDAQKKHRPFVSIIPLMEILNEILKSPTKAMREYERLTQELGTEFDILLKLPYEKIEKIGGTKLKEAVEIIRERKAYVDPGYDGIFGVVKIFGGEKKEIKPIEEKKADEKQPTLF